MVDKLNIFKSIKKHRRRVLIHAWFIASALGMFSFGILLLHQNKSILIISALSVMFAAFNFAYILRFLYLFGKIEPFQKGGFELKVNDNITLYINSYKIGLYKGLTGTYYINASVDMIVKDKCYGDVCIIIPATEYLTEEYNKFIENRYSYIHSKSNEIFLKIIAAATIRVCRKYCLIT